LLRGLTAARMRPDSQKKIAARADCCADATGQPKKNSVWPDTTARLKKLQRTDLRGQTWADRSEPDRFNRSSIPVQPVLARMVQSTPSEGFGDLMTKEIRVLTVFVLSV
jgi:hypothetical protein